MNTIKVGVVGCGVVGSGVCQLLTKHAKHIAGRVGARVQLAAVADRSLANAKKLKLPKSTQLVKDGFALAADPAIDIVVELIGGTTVAYDLVKIALENGKHVVTANKALLAERGDKLFQLAEKNGVQLLFEAAVGGAIPVVRTIKQDLAGDRIDRVFGILNGTCNFILTKMAAEGVDFAPTLREAQQLGYAEADPTLDISGGDTAHKIALLASLAFGTTVNFKKVHIEGITELSAADFSFAEKLGRVIKLIAVAKQAKAGPSTGLSNGHTAGQALELRVAPTLLPADHLLAKIDGSTNAVQLHAAGAGDVTLVGAGAGSLPTASAVVGDVVEAARSVILSQSKYDRLSFDKLRMTGVPNLGTQEGDMQTLPISPIGETTSGFYLRFAVKDQPGIVQAISTVLTKNHLSIRDMLQLDLHEFTQAVPLAVVLHPAEEQKIRHAVRELNRLRCMAEKVVVLRVED